MQLLKKITEAESQAELKEICREANPSINRRTGVRCLLDLFISMLPDYASKGESPIPLLETMNSVIPRFCKDSLQTDIYKLFRRAIREVYPKGHKALHDMMYVMRFDQDKFKANRERYEKQVAIKNRTPRDIDFNSIVSMVEDWNKGGMLSQKIALLQIASGCRIGEILHKASFKRGDKKHHVVQTGVLKTKNKDLTVTKPILFMRVSGFLGLFKLVREHLKGENLDNVYKRVVALLKKYDLKTHSLRKIYAELAWQVYGGKQKQSFYASEILGHDINSTASANSYTTVHIDGVDHKKVKRLLR